MSVGKFRSIYFGGGTEMSALFTPAKPIPGQATMPLGTHHIDAQGNSYVCDCENCRLPFHTADPFAHACAPVNVEAVRRPKREHHQRDLFNPELF